MSLSSFIFFFFFIIPRPPRSTLFPYTTLFRSLWLKLVKDFLKVRCRLALLPFLISCLIWLDLVASLPLIKLLPDRKSGSAGMPRPISYAVFCLKKKKKRCQYELKQINEDSNSLFVALVSPICHYPRLYSFFFSLYRDHQDLHSFPTRRSSDLYG